MSVTVPLERDTTNFDVQVTLEDVTYTLDFRWNVRLGAWFMNILDAEGVNLIRAGLRLVTGWPLDAYTAVRTPPGAFIVIDTTGAEEEPDRDGLGDRWQLVYFTSSELDQ